MAKYTRSAEQFRDAVSKGLVGTPVLAVTSVPDLGSSFELGEWIPRQHVVENPALRERQRLFKGSKSLYVRCPWELNTPRNLVSPGTKLVGQEARMKLLEALEGETIVRVSFKDGDLGVALEVQGGATLKLFPSSHGFRSGGYTVGLDEGYWTVTFDGATSLSTAE